MSDKPREWTLEYDYNFDDHPPCVTDGPNIKPTEMEIRVIEKSAYDQSTQEIEALEALLEKLGSLVEEIRIGKDRPGDWRLWLLRCGWFQQADEALAMLAEHKMKGSGG